MRETDISKFTAPIGETDASAGGAKRFFKALGRVLFTILMVFVVTGVIIGISLSVCLT